MDTILFFSLIFAAYDVSQKELQSSSCQIKQFPGLFPRDPRSIKVLLLIQEAQREAKREAPSQDQTLATLQCLGSTSKVTVDLRDSEKRPNTRYTFKDLNVITTSLPDNVTGPRCYLSTEPKLWFQTDLHLTVQVFLPNISNCKCYSVVETSLERPSTTTIITTISEDGEEEKSPIIDLLVRKKWSSVVKALIAITLLISAIAIAVFVVFEVPCPCTCPRVRNLCHCQHWRRQKEDGIEGGPRPRAAAGPVTGNPEKVEPRITEAHNSSPKKSSEIIVIHQTYF